MKLLSYPFHMCAVYLCSSCVLVCAMCRVEGQLYKGVQNVTMPTKVVHFKYVLCMYITRTLQLNLDSTRVSIWDLYMYNKPNHQPLSTMRL